jgi:hypothetical protein
MSLKKWLESMIHPSKSNLADGTAETIMIALNEPGVRRRWVESLIEELWQLNIKIDRLMEQEAEKEWPKISQRRNAIVYCLQLILDSKSALDYERASAPEPGPFEGVAVQRD